MDNEKKQNYGSEIEKIIKGLAEKSKTEKSREPIFCLEDYLVEHQRKIKYGEVDLKIARYDPHQDPNRIQPDTQGWTPEKRESFKSALQILKAELTNQP